MCEIARKYASTNMKERREKRETNTLFIYVKRIIYFDWTKPFCILKGLNSEYINLTDLVLRFDECESMLNCVEHGKINLPCCGKSFYMCLLAV